MKSFKSLLVGTASVSTLMLGVSAYAQDNPDDEIIVTGIRSSLQKSIAVKRNADSILEAITAEDIGKFPDKNVAESLQRVTGISVQRDFGEGERVSIRGAGSNQNLTQLNGHAVATADWFILDQLAATRSFNYLLLPSEIVGNLEVYKSTQANLDVGGIGGTINVHTRNPLEMDNFTAQGSIQGAYNDLADEIDPYGSALLSWKNEDSTLGFLLAGNYQKRSLRRDGFEILGYTATSIADQGGAVLEAPNLIGSTLFQQERVRKGVNATLAYSPTDNFDLTLNGLWSEMQADNYNQNYMAWVSQTLSAVQPTNTTVGADGTLLGGTFASNATTNGVVYDAILRDATTETKAIDLDLNYAASDTLRFHAKIGYTEALGATTNEPFFETNASTGFTYDLTQRAPQVSFTDIDPTNAADLSSMVVGWSANNRASNDDSEFFLYADVEKDVDLGPVKTLRAGLKYADHERDVKTINGQRRSIINAVDGACNATAVCSLADVAGELTPSDYLDGLAIAGSLSSYIQVNPDLLQALHDRLTILPRTSSGNAIDTQFTGTSNSDTVNLGSLFTVAEETFAGYVMADFEDDKIRGNVGVRVVSTEQVVDNFTGVGFISPLPPNVILSPFNRFIPNNQSATHTDILPSVNIAYDLNDEVILRAAAGRSLARPDYNLLGGAINTTALTLTGSGGNFNLEPIRANNFDLSLEYYPDNDTIFAATLFHKDFSSAIVNDTVTSQEVLEVASATDPRVVDASNNCNALSGTTYLCDFALSVPTNGSGYQVQGFELNAQKAFSNGFGVMANFTFSDASGVDYVPENSKYTGNASIYYENDKLSTRLTYSYRSKYFINVDRGSNLFSDSVDSLDGSFSYSITPNIDLTLDAINLLDNELYQYYGNPDKPARLYKNGRWVFFGARAKF